MDFKTAVHTVLGVEMGGNLVSLNVDALQGVMFAMLRKISEFAAKLERLEYDLDSKAPKIDVYGLREKIKALPAQEVLENMVKTLEEKADRSDIELIFENVQELKDKWAKMDAASRSKATKQDLEIMQSQISYLQEAVGNQEQVCSTFHLPHSYKAVRRYKM
jgi:hypothetical protein